MEETELVESLAGKKAIFVVSDAIILLNFPDVLSYAHTILKKDAGVQNVDTPWKNLSISLHDFFVRHNNFTAQCRRFGAFCETWKSSRYYLQLLAT